MPKYSKIYFTGIKGVGMAGLAIVAKEAGIEVEGSDIKDEFITDKELVQNKIKINVGFEEGRVEEFFADTPIDKCFLITTGAHRGFDNPQVLYARNRGIKVATQGQALGDFMSGAILGRKNIKGISVAGSHGKTTITAMAATVLSLLGTDPSYVVGTGEIFPLGYSAHFGHGEYFVGEADEYVSEIKYDKKPKLLYQHPYIAIINNIDFDHPDFYGSVEEIEEVFLKFSENLPQGGILFINGDDKKLLSLKEKVRQDIRVITYGTSSTSDYFISRFSGSGANSFFTVERKEVKLGDFALSIPGQHNAINSLGVIALCIELGFLPDKIREALSKFTGTKRRLEIVGTTKSGALIVDDYAHHPEEIRATLDALKRAYPEKKIVCVFQPHSISRTEALLPEFAQAFGRADKTIILPVYITQREDESEYSYAKLMEEFRKLGRDVTFSKNDDFMVEYLIQNFRGEGYLILTAGAGDVYNLAYKLKG